MTEKIISALKHLEERHQIKILLAVESGSRAWGFASENSDWDVRFIYVHTLEWYLSVQPQKDTLEIMLPDDLDLSGWELRKALQLFKRSNPPLLEWLRSPLLYLESGTFADTLRSAASEYFNPKKCLYHYFHMARRNWEAYFKTDEARLKKYLYVLRPVLCCLWIEKTGEMPPVEFDKLRMALVKDDALADAIDALLMRKMSGEELQKGPRIPVLDNFLNGQLKAFELKLKSQYEFVSPDWTMLNNIFRNTISESWQVQEPATLKLEPVTTITTE